MSNITDWIKYTLYPELFNYIDTAFPEHRFLKTTRGWQSATYLDGTGHNRKDKTVISAAAIGRIMEQGGANLSLIDYIMQRDSLEFKEATEKLAAAAGLQLPKLNYEDTEYYKQQEFQRGILESANEYFKWCLYNSKNADIVQKYLELRGYSLADSEGMELGFIPSQKQLFEHLQKSYSEDSIKESLKIRNDSRIGTSHKLTIPFRSGGILKGFKFRAISNEDKPKYLNSTGLDKTSSFFNISGLKGDKDLIVVEGDLDALHATIRGIDNVVATAGSNITPEQISDAKRRGAKSITLCFDQDVNFDQNVLKALQILESEQDLKVYIASLPKNPTGKTDPDSLIKEQGVEAFKAVIDEALRDYKYRLQFIINKHDEILGDRKFFTDKEEAAFLEEIQVTAAKIQNPIDRDIFRQLFIESEGVKALGIKAESLTAASEQLRFKSAEEARIKEVKTLLNQVQQQLEKGETTSALVLLNNKSREIQQQEQSEEFSFLLSPLSENVVKERLASKPDNIKSGFRIDDEEILFPSGALTILAAPTSHGKTTILLNSLINVATEYSEKQAYFFSYEESQESIFIKTLNCFIGEEISANNKESIKSYFAKGSLEFIKHQKQSLFLNKKEEFFKTLVDTQRVNIHYTDYSSDTLINAIRYLHANAKPGAIFIDYMQLLHKGTHGKNKYNSRQEELKQICLDLKDVAVETDLPIILGAQFNREVVNPLLLHSTKIGEAGDIERVANLIIGFWNTAFKSIATDKELKEIHSIGADTEKSIYTVILKNRDGVVAAQEALSFDGNATKITNRIHKIGF